MDPLLVGRVGFFEFALILAVLLVPVAVVAFLVWVARRGPDGDEV